MFVGHLLLLLFALCFANGFKLNEIEWKTNNDTSRRDRIDSPEVYKEDEQTVAMLLWTLSCFTMFSIVYGLYGSGYGPFVSTLYTALSHSGWAASLSWILIACVCGHGGVINKVLSCKHLYPLSRLSYCVYLLHPAIMRAVLTAGEDSLHLSVGFMTIMFLGFTVASYAVGLFISLLFEAPMVSLLRIIHPLRQWKKE